MTSNVGLSLNERVNSSSTQVASVLTQTLKKVKKVMDSTNGIKTTEFRQLNEINQGLRGCVREFHLENLSMDAILEALKTVPVAMQSIYGQRRDDEHSFYHTGLQRAVFQQPYMREIIKDQFHEQLPSLKVKMEFEFVQEKDFAEAKKKLQKQCNELSQHGIMTSEEVKTFCAEVEKRRCDVVVKSIGEQFRCRTEEDLRKNFTAEVRSLDKSLQKLVNSGMLTIEAKEKVLVSIYNENKDLIGRFVAQNDNISIETEILKVFPSAVQRVVQPVVHDSRGEEQPVQNSPKKEEEPVVQSSPEKEEKPVIQNLPKKEAEKTEEPVDEVKPTTNWISRAGLVTLGLAGGYALGKALQNPQLLLDGMKASVEWTKSALSRLKSPGSLPQASTSATSSEYAPTLSNLWMKMLPQAPSIPSLSSYVPSMETISSYVPSMKTISSHLPSMQKISSYVPSMETVLKYGPAVVGSLAFLIYGVLTYHEYVASLPTTEEEKKAVTKMKQVLKQSALLERNLEVNQRVLAEIKKMISFQAELDTKIETQRTELADLVKQLKIEDGKHLRFLSDEQQKQLESLRNPKTTSQTVS